MNDFLLTMSEDMGITRFNDETNDSFIYRLCYSALGQWGLQIARSSSGGAIGTSKHNQTIVLNDLIQRYSELFPNISDKFMNEKDPQNKLSVHIRKTYEETGHLLTDKNNHNRIANYGRSIVFKDSALYFGLPSTSYTVNGLGAFSRPTEYQISVNDFLIRDNLTTEEYLNVQYDIIDFYDRDIDLTELQFFNPLSSNVPSQSWISKIRTNYTIARKSEQGPFYRIIEEPNGTILFADEIIEQQTNILTSYEFRRIYFALKAHYGNPLKATISQIDESYSHLRLRGHLPNREYYFLLLLSWPANNAFDKVNFIIKNEFIPKVTMTLENIGITIEGGNTNA